MIAEISSVMSLANKALDYINNNDVDGMIKNGQLGLSMQGSITKLIAETIIAPRIIVSESLKTNGDIDKIVNLNIDIITGMVSKAFVLLTELKGLQPNAAFDILKTSKGTMSGLESVSNIEKEDLHKQMLTSKGLTFGKVLTARLEADNRPIKKDDITAIYSKDIDLKLDVKTKDGSIKSIVLPIIIKAHISYNSLARIKEDLIDKSFEKGFGERLLEVKAGLISFKNFALPFDMLKAYKDKKIKDVDSLLAYTEGRSSLSTEKLLTGGISSLSTFLGSLVLTYNDMEDIENNVLRGSIQKPAKRELLFSNAKVCLLNIVDTDYEKLTIVTKDIDGQSIMDIKSLKKNSNGNDMGDIFKDILMNRRF